MQTVLLLSTRESICRSWMEALEDYNLISCKDEFDCIKHLQEFPQSIILLHINSFEGEVKKFLKKVHSDYAQAHTILLSDIPSFNEGIALLRIGVNGYGNSYINRSHLQHALSVIADGNIWLYPKFLDTLIKETPSRPDNEEQHKKLNILSKRELEIAELVAQGLSNQEIAQHSQITVRTVKAHITSIFEKLHISDRLSLALFMRQL